MALVLADRVKDTTTTAGTGTITLSGTPPTGYQAFSVIGNGNTTYYTIAGGSQWEVGIGTYTSSGTTLSRDTVLASSAGGTTKVDFAAGTKDVFVTYPAEKSVNYDGSDNVGIGTTTPGAKLNVVDNSSNDAVRITQTGVGNALVVEDSTNPDASPFVVTATGDVVVGHTATVTDGVGSAPKFQVLGNATATARYFNVLYQNSSSDAVFAFAKSRSDTIGVQTIVQADDGLGTINFEGSDGVQFRRAARIQAVVDGTPGAGDMPGRLVFSTTADGAATVTERMRISSTGNVGIGTATTTARFTLAGGQSAAAWTTSGIGLVQSAATFTDTTSTGTVAAVYINSFAAQTLAASNTITVTNLYGTYFTTPVAGTNVTAGAAFGLGADTLRVNGIAQVTGTFTASGGISFTTTTGTIALGTSLTSGVVTIGSTGGTGTITLGQSTVSQTTNIQAGVTASGSTKTLNIGTGGASGSTTTITIGSSTSGATSTIGLNGTVTLNTALGVASGGTGTNTAFTAGSVVFAGASGVYSQDNSNLFWDNTNKRLGIGTTAPVYGISVDDGVLSQRRYGVVGNFILQRADGTKGSPTAVASGVAVGGPTGQAYDGTDYRTIGAVRFVTNGATSGTNYGGDIIFVTGDPGATTSSTKMRLDGYGQLGLGVTPSAWGSFYKAIESTSSSEFAITSQQNGVEFGRGYYKINSGFASIATTTQATSKYAQDANGVHAWYYGTATTVGGTISFTQAMTLDASGNLGVGTTSPTSLGSGYKSIDVRGANGGGLVIGTTTPTDIGFVYGNTSGLIIQAAGSTLPIIFNTNSGERARISTTGGLSVGTTTDPGAGKILAAKGILPRVNAQTTTTSPWAWNSDDYDQQSFSALANALTINADAGTPTDGEKQILRFKDNATPRTLTFTGGSSKAFRDMTGQLTVSGSNWTYTTVASKTVYFGCVYNNADSRWDIIAVTQEP